MRDSNWERVGRDNPCPICGKTSWCGVAVSGDAALCQRIEEGAIRRVGDAGWLHPLGDRVRRGPRPPRRSIIRRRPPAGRAEIAEMAESYRRAVPPGRLGRFARILGVEEASLARLGVGRSEGHGAWSFPMTDADGGVIGIRFRTEGGSKFALPGSREGLFVPGGLVRPEVLLIAEGATDTAALLGLGFDAVGRPSCRGGRALVLALVARLRPASVVVVADNDPGHQGRDGALELARQLAPLQGDVRVIAPRHPFKDARVWIQAGAARGEFLAAIESSARIAIDVRSRPLPPTGAGESHHAG